MKAPTFDELVLLPEPLAIQRHFDARNYRAFRFVLVLVTILCLAGIAQAVESSNSLAGAIYALDIIAGAILFGLRRQEFFTRNFRQILLVYLFVQILVLKFTAAPLNEGEKGPFIAVAFLLLVFRLRLAEHVMLFVSFWAAAVFPLSWLGVRRAATEPADPGGVIAVSIVSLVCLLAAAGFTQLTRRRFLAVWRREHSRHRERLRMREEIEYARKIQLSMLPQGGPEVDWLDLAAASLPATEVGGDYYEFFLPTESRMILVIGDVAGHGLASGLLLSGVRSCLYLLEEELTSPIPVMERLNHMVRRTTDKRTYVTLLCAVLDRAEETLTVVSAGHPPVLHYGPRSRRFEEVGKGAPPLGTFLEAGYEAVRRPLVSGDLLIFYTDGLVEARNARGQEYGEARLQKAVARAADSRTSRQVRDAILGDLSNFKGDQEQADDLTLVVVRMR
jgi:serine phosphatase RsbU (regulator of sigma subunit)